MHEHVQISREAQFLVVRTGQHATLLAKEIGCQADRSARDNPTHPRVEVWEIVEQGTSVDHLSALTNTLFQRIRPLHKKLTAMCANPEVGCVFRVVECLGPRDITDPGFILENTDIALLHDLRASIDVDLYSSSPNRLHLPR